MTNWMNDIIKNLDFDCEDAHENYFRNYRFNPVTGAFKYNITMKWLQNYDSKCNIQHSPFYLFIDVNGIRIQPQPEFGLWEFQYHVLDEL